MGGITAEHKPCLRGVLAVRQAAPSISPKAPQLAISLQYGDCNSLGNCQGVTGRHSSILGCGAVHDELVFGARARLPGVVVRAVHHRLQRPRGADAVRLLAPAETVRGRTIPWGRTHSWAQGEGEGHFKTLSWSFLIKFRGAPRLCSNQDLARSLKCSGIPFGFRSLTV